MSILDAPPDIAQLHPKIDGWTRSLPWRRSMLRRDHYQTTYSLKQRLPENPTKPVVLLNSVRVFVHRNVIKDTAAAWDIARQITAGRRSPRREKSADLPTLPQSSAQSEGDRL